MPFGRLAELPLLAGAIAGFALALRHPRALAAEPRLPLLAALFLGYWLPELCSAPDAVAPRKAWTEVAADLRFLPFALFALAALPEARALRRLFALVAAILALWLLDAAARAAARPRARRTGGRRPPLRHLRRRRPQARADAGGALADPDLDRGPPAWSASRRCSPSPPPARWCCWPGPARAGWSSRWWRLPGCASPHPPAVASRGPRRSVPAPSSAPCSRPRSRNASPPGSSAALGCSPARREAIDHALAGRLPIWRTALAVYVAHPVNGVGVRGFRHAYPEHAAAGDPWVGFAGDPALGAFHPHQLLLELAAETGTLGLLAWTLAAWAAIRGHRRSHPAVRAEAQPLTVALAVMLFPLNTHFAFYSSFWGLLLWWLAAVFGSALRRPPAPP
ncbi:MAG: O-antigen ligase family protein [Xanthomonadales bacterium]|nr:O-antigen ligase family protein [Xanthomonadales bacterium]